MDLKVPGSLSEFSLVQGVKLAGGMSLLFDPGAALA